MVTPIQDPMIIIVNLKINDVEYQLEGFFLMHIPTYLKYSKPETLKSLKTLKRDSPMQPMLIEIEL